MSRYNKSGIKKRKKRYIKYDTIYFIDILHLLLKQLLVILTPLIVAKNTDQVVIIVALTKEKENIHNIWTLMIQSTLSIYYNGY